MASAGVTSRVRAAVSAVPIALRYLRRVHFISEDVVRSLIREAGLEVETIDRQRFMVAVFCKPPLTADR